MKKHPTPLQKGLAGGLLALMLLTAAPQGANAQTPSLAELQAQITQLQALLANLTGASTGSALGAYTWTTTLRTGSTGTDVRELQRFLNSDPDTRVAISGAGSAGNETMYFGPATAAAVSKFQMKYRSEILTPNGLVNPTGIFGPSSIAKANALRNATPSNPTNPNNPSNPTNPSTPVLQGEGQLDRVIFESADDTEIREGASEAPIGILTMTAEDGDIRLDRLDVRLVADNGNTEKDPWDTFSSIALVVDGEEIASKRIDRKNDYQNRSTGAIRFSGINTVLEDGEDTEIEVVVTVQNGVKGAGTSASWNLHADSVRYFDADRVASTDTSTGDLGTSVAFDIVPRGEGEELKFMLGQNNPVATTIVVDDTARTNNVKILEYTIEAIDGDIELDTLAVKIETGTAAFSDVVDRVRLVIDGETFRSQSITTTGDYSTTSVLATFDIDGRVTIDDEDTVDVAVIVDFKPQIAYQNGETITASVTSAERALTDAEGDDDVTQFSGTAVGETHRLMAAGLSVDVDDVEFTTTVQGQNSTTGVYTIAFDVTAIEGDYYVKRTASTSVDTTTGGVGFSINGGSDFTTVSATLSSTAKESLSGVYVVREGETETFTLMVVLDPTIAGMYNVGLTNIVYSTNTTGITGSESYALTPSQKFRTPFQFINN